MGSVSEPAIPQRRTGWALVYASQWVFTFLPVFIVRGAPLRRRVVLAYLAIVMVAYAGFPSLHVAYSWLAALVAFHVHRGVGRVALLWAAVISVSTLFTKQHYVVDVVAGVAIACGAYAVFVRRAPRAWLAYVTR